jgi:hypothetical protein
LAFWVRLIGDSVFSHKFVIPAKNNESLKPKTDCTAQIMTANTTIPTHILLQMEAFEEALTKAKIPFCRPEQLIGVFEKNPQFIIPKYKIAIFLQDEVNHENSSYKNWKIFRSNSADVATSVSLCLNFI